MYEQYDRPLNDDWRAAVRDTTKTVEDMYILAGHLRNVLSQLTGQYLILSFLCNARHELNLPDDD